MSKRRYLIKISAIACALALLFPLVSFGYFDKTEAFPASQSKTEIVAVKTNTSPQPAAPLENVVYNDKIPESKALAVLDDTCQPEEQTKSPNEETYAVTEDTVNAVKAGESSKGNPIDSIKSFLALYEAGINNLNVYLVDVGDGLQEIAADYDNDLGEKYVFKSGIYYDAANLLLYGKDDTGIFALGFDFDIGQLTIYAADNGWNREMGFCSLYDVLAPLINYDYLTTRVKFSYADKDWMIQFWKGRYIIAMGGEVGIYYKPQDRLIDFYDCADDEHRLPISMRLLKGNKVLFEREMLNCWWQSGFNLGLIYLPIQLTLESTLVFPNDTMRDAFTQAANRLVCTGFTYTVDGLAVSVAW